jgi:hypothetical protein
MLFAAVHESGVGAFRPFAALDYHGHCWRQSGHFAEPTQCHRTVLRRLRPVQPMRPQVSIGDTRHSFVELPSIVRPQEEICRVGLRVPLSGDETPADHRLRGIAEPGLPGALELPLPDDCRSRT